MNKKDFPKWIFKTKNGQTYAFRNVNCKEGFKVAVRVGMDGVLVFGKNSSCPNLYYMNSQEYASLEDFKGSNGNGFKGFEVGCVRSDGSYWFSDCFFEPGLIAEDFNDVKKLLLAFYDNYKARYAPTKKQLDRIQKMMELRGEKFVKAYFYQQFPFGDFNNLCRDSAQKIITGLQWIEQRKPLSNVYVNPNWIT